MQALQSQATSQQQALADMSRQHQEVCSRLAEAVGVEAGLQQQLARISTDKQALQQQVERVGTAVTLVTQFGIETVVVGMLHLLQVVYFVYKIPAAP